MSTTKTAEQIGREYLREEASPEVTEKAARLVLEGKAQWVFDPQVDGVVGLVRPDEPNRAFIVVWYTDGDFEISLDFDEV